MSSGLWNPVDPQLTNFRYWGIYLLLYGVWLGYSALGCVCVRMCVCAHVCVYIILVYILYINVHFSISINQDASKAEEFLGQLLHSD